MFSVKSRALIGKEYDPKNCNWDTRADADEAENTEAPYSDKSLPVEADPSPLPGDVSHYFPVESGIVSPEVVVFQGPADFPQGLRLPHLFSSRSISIPKYRQIPKE